MSGAEAVSAEIVEKIARLAHEVMRAYDAALGARKPNWQLAPVWMKRSTRNGVLYAIRNPDVSPAAAHEEWCRKKVEEGWSHGADDAGARTHPCLLPYDELTLEHRVKDYLFLGVVRALTQAMPDALGEEMPAPPHGEPPPDPCATA